MKPEVICTLKLIVKRRSSKDLEMAEVLCLPEKESFSDTYGAYHLSGAMFKVEEKGSLWGG